MPGRSLGSRWHGSRASATSLGSLPTEVTSPNRLFTSAAVTTVTACHRCPSVLLGEVGTNASLPLMDLSIILSRGGGPAHTALAGPSPRAVWCDLIVWRGLCVCIYAAANRGSQEEGKDFKTWHIHAIECYSAIIMNAVRIHATWEGTLKIC